MAKFKLADPVWAKSEGTYIPAGEYAAEITLVAKCECGGSAYAFVHVIGPYSGNEFTGCERLLRPRRDDYQQHEPLGNMADVRREYYSNKSAKEHA